MPSLLMATDALQAVAPGMVKRCKGRIVVIGSITAFLASPFNGAYAVMLCSTLTHLTSCAIANRANYE